MEKQYLRVEEASQYLGVGKSTILLFTKQGKIKDIKLSDGVTVWTKSDLDAFRASREGSEDMIFFVIKIVKTIFWILSEFMDLPYDKS
ncbi:MAG: helix-turn-helix domain-containing protein [Sulfuricurvum sp.]